MKTGDIVFLKRPYKGYRAVELMERLEYRWLVRIVRAVLNWRYMKMNLYQNFNTNKVLWKISVCIPFGNNRLYLSSYRRGQKKPYTEKWKRKSLPP